ncbi:cupin domain-containing protein [Micromonospora musae]|uniref:cupin domain-containing protein n=1 Tax=Micromonospora musae TaxID=1894970 RepID=UPI0034423898
MDKVQVRRLPVTAPPLPDEGGRLQSPAGEFARIVNGGTYRYLAYLEFRPETGRPRGNHYHERKIEILYVISGRLRAAYEDLESGERSQATLEAGDLVTVLPRCAHVYYADGPAQAVELAAEPYDPDDVHPYEVGEAA